MEEEIKEAGKAWFKSLRPPQADSTDSHVQAWRWSIAITTGATTLALIIHILLACGFLTFIHPGFANAADVQHMREERRVERETDLETKILDVRQKQCVAEPTVKGLHTQTLQKMLVEYDKLTGRQYPLPNCEDFR